MSLPVASTNVEPCVDGIVIGEDIFTLNKGCSDVVASNSEESSEVVGCPTGVTTGGCVVNTLTDVVSVSDISV